MAFIRGTSQFFTLDNGILLEIQYHDKENPDTISTGGNGSSIGFFTNGLTKSQTLFNVPNGAPNFEILYDEGLEIYIINESFGDVYFERNTRYILDLNPLSGNQGSDVAPFGFGIFDSEGNLVSEHFNDTGGISPIDLLDPNLGKNGYIIFDSTETETFFAGPILRPVNDDLSVGLPFANFEEFNYVRIQLRDDLPTDVNTQLANYTGNTLDRLCTPINSNKNYWVNLVNYSDPNRYWFRDVDATDLSFLPDNTIEIFDIKSGQDSLSNFFPKWGSVDEFKDLKSIQFDNINQNEEVIYDTFIFHFAAGYRLNRDADALIFEIGLNDTNDKFQTLSSVLYEVGDKYEIYNPNPFIIEQTLYNRYIEIKVPTISGKIAPKTSYLGRIKGSSNPNKLEYYLSNGQTVDEYFEILQEARGKVLAAKDQYNELSPDNGTDVEIEIARNIFIEETKSLLALSGFDPETYDFNDIGEKILDTIADVPNNFNDNTFYVSLDDLKKQDSFVLNSPYLVNLYKMSLVEDNIGATESQTYKFYKKEDVSDFVFSSNDLFGGIESFIDSSTQGDWFEFGASYFNGPISNYIDVLVQKGADIIVDYQISLLYQKGSVFVILDQLNSTKDRGFDEPLKYRPVIPGGLNTPTFVMDFTYRILSTNKEGVNITKRATKFLTQEEYLKYGPKLRALNFEGRSPLKIYNKIIR